MPRCLSCGAKLRRYHYRADGPRPIEGTDPSRQWGDYGDNHFCALRCGYNWAVMYLKRQPDYAERLHSIMLQLMTKKET